MVLLLCLSAMARDLAILLTAAGPRIRDGTVDRFQVLK